MSAPNPLHRRIYASRRMTKIFILVAAWRLAGLFVVSSLVCAGSGIPIPNGTWTYVLTKGIPEEANGWEQLVYAPALHQSVMLAQYHQRNSEPNESLVGYNFDFNNWNLLDMGGLFHTETMPEGGESQGYFDFNPNNNTIVYYCCTTGSNQPENAFHTWWYDVLGQSGRDKHTSPKPPASALQPGGAFDAAHNVFVFHGGDSFVGTWTYDPSANSWKKMNPGGTSPDPSVILAGVAYSSKEQKIYLFGGQSGTTYYSDLYVYDYPTNTWTLLSPTGGVRPPARYRHAFAYDSKNNIFLLYGGQSASGSVLNDTWVYNPAANTWRQLTPPQSPYPSGSAIFAKMTYDSDHNVFVLAQTGAGGGYYGGTWAAYGVETWLFRYAGGGPDAGTKSPAVPVPGGSLNRYNQGWGKDPVLASSGNSLYVGWSEVSSPFDASDAAWPHIYVSQFSGSTWVPLGTLFTSISSDLFEAHGPSLAVIGGTPWVSWYQSSNNGQMAAVSAASWNGSSAWTGSRVGFNGTSTPGLFQGESQITGIGGVPHIAVLEIDKTVYPQRTLAYVRAWNGSAWSLKGTALNRNTSAGATAQSVSIASNGANPIVAWSEYLHAGASGYDTDTNPQIYVSQWNGTQWTALGGSLNVNSANWAYDPFIAYFNGAPYVAWVERSQTGNAQVYIKTWNGSSWVPVGSGTLNRAPGAGWAYHPSLAVGAAGNTLYLAWVEQVALGHKAQVFVSRYAAGAWSALGGALNMDPLLGSAQRVSLGVYNGQPVAAWGEVNMGAMRQIFVKQWNGSAWTQLPGPGVTPDIAPPTTPSNPTATVASSSQINVSWSPSSDTVGVMGYLIYRNGTQAANVTANITYQDTGLSPSTTYSYTISAYDAAGNISAHSASVSATTQGASTVSLASIGLSPGSTVGGASTTANTVALTGSASSGGAVVNLTSGNPIVTVPATVMVPAGAATSPAFAITTAAVTANTPVTVSATYNGVTKSATLNVLPPRVSAVTLSPAIIVGGGSSTANAVTLNGPAPAGGAVVTLSSSNPAVTVPASVTVAAGASISPAFTIRTPVVPASTFVTISATYNGVTATGSLTLSPIGVSAVTLSPASVVGGNSTTGNITLSSPAPAGGAVVNLSSNNSGVTVPTTVTVAAGSSVSPVFSITTSVVPAITTVSISATYNGITRPATLTVAPISTTSPSAVILSPTSVLGGSGITGMNTVSLTGPAPSGGMAVSLTSSNPSVTLPASVTVPAGSTLSPNFIITTTPVPANLTVTISATSGGVTKTANLTVLAPTVSLLTVSPGAVTGGVPSGGYVRLNGQAPAGGAVVTLASNNPAVTVPSSVTVAAGATVSPTFAITTRSVAAGTPVTISATYNGVTTNATLTVNPVALSSISLYPTSIVGGSAITGMNTVSLNGPAPSGGLVVNLASSNPSVTLPASVTVPAGSNVSPQFIIGTIPVKANLTVNISATYNGVTKSTTLAVTP